MVIIGFLVIIASISGCISPKEEAISIAKKHPDFNDQNASFREENNTWVVETENTTIVINPKTKEIKGVYKVSEEEAKKLALGAWLRERVMIPENKPVAVAEDKGEYWLVTVQIVDMFTGEIIERNAGQYRVDKETREVTE